MNPVMSAHVRVHSTKLVLHRANRDARVGQWQAFPAMLTRAARVTWLVVGFLSLSLGALGIALPLLPTTPFILVAAVAFARSSKRLHAWLVNHDVFGSLIDNWQRHGAISRRAKVASVLSMATLLAISLAMAVPMAAIGAQLIVLGAVAIFILTRPAPPAE